MGVISNPLQSLFNFASLPNVKGEATRLAEELNITSEEELEAWLQEKPIEWSRLIALRAALRVWPLTAKAYSLERHLNEVGSTAIHSWRDAFQLQNEVAGDRFSLSRQTGRAAILAPTDSDHQSLSAIHAAMANSNLALLWRTDDKQIKLESTIAAVTACVDAFRSAGMSSVSYVRADAEAIGIQAANYCWSLVQEDCLGLDYTSFQDVNRQPLFPSKREYAQKLLDFSGFERSFLLFDTPNAAVLRDWYMPLLHGTTDERWNNIFLGERARDLALHKNQVLDRDTFWTITDDRPASKIIDDVAEALGWFDQRLAIPVQKTGLQFDWLNGTIQLARGFGLTGKETDESRIQAQLPILRQLLDQLAEQLRDSQFDQLRDTLTTLQSITSLSATQLIGVSELATWSLVLRNQIDEASTPPDAEGSNAYALSGGAKATAKSVATITDLIVLATDEGRKLYDDADRAEHDAGAMEEFRRKELEILDLIEAEDSLVDPYVLVLLKAALTTANGQVLPRRSAHLAKVSTGNLLMVLFGGGFVAAVLTSPGFVFGSAALIFIIERVFGEAIKTSAPGKALNDVLRDRIDARSASFIEANKGKLRELAGGRQSMKWLTDFLDAWEEYQRHKELDR